VLLAPRLAHGDDGVELSWVRGKGADGCPGLGDLRAGVLERLRRDPFVPGGSRTFEAGIQREGDRWVATIVERDAAGAPLGERELTSDAPECRSIASAVALALALAIDPDAFVEPPRNAPTRPRPQGREGPVAAIHGADLEPCARPGAPGSPDGSSASPSARPAAVRVGVGALLTTGIVPGAAPGIAWDAGLRVFEHLYATGGVWWLPESRKDTFAFGLTAASLGMCLAGPRWGPVTASGCAGLLAGSVHSVVFELTPTQPGDRIWVAASFTPHLSFSVVGPSYVDVGGAVVVPFRPYDFAVAGHTDPAYREAAVSLAGLLGAGVQIP
jgi:hypothetical protein